MKKSPHGQALTKGRRQQSPSPKRQGKAKERGLFTTQRRGSAGRPEATMHRSGLSSPSLSIEERPRLTEGADTMRDAKGEVPTNEITILIRHS